MNSLRPTCAVCHKLVDSFDELVDHFMDRFILIARCHGQTERIVVNAEEAGQIKCFGLAFVPAKELTP